MRDGLIVDGDIIGSLNQMRDGLIEEKMCVDGEILGRMRDFSGRVRERF